MSIVDAAAIPEVWLTAFQLLHFVAKIKQGDTVLVHAGGSGVGTAATQLALLHGAKSVMITAGSEGKRARGLELGASHAFERGDAWADQVLEATGGRGVDVVLDCVGGSYWQQNVKALAMDGRWAVYGLMGGSEVNGPILAGILRKRLTVVGTTLRARTNDYKAELVAAFTKVALPLFSASEKVGWSTHRHFLLLCPVCIIGSHSHSSTNVTTLKPRDTQ
jgi:tumor protein p53-inducible protein 3